MNDIKKIPLQRLGYDFIPPEYIPDGKDEYYLRARQQFADRDYRSLREKEIETLVKNENVSDDWTRISVTGRFNPELVKSCQFFGLVRLGDLEANCVEHHDLRLPVGLYNSTIVSCDIGSQVAIHNVHYLGHYIIGDEVILLDINEMHTSNHAKFGNGILKEGEEEEIRIWLELWNETGNRAVLPFDGIRAGDAYIWAKYRDEPALMQRFLEMTDARFDTRRGYYGTVGDHSVIKHCGIIKDVAIGSHAYIKGANKLKNLTVKSDAAESAQIGEGVELVNGIIGFGCRIFYGVKAVRFVMGANSNLKYGARLINSFLGDNSTVSCCEMLHNLIFPSHEQHHNNSFLTATLVKGQSNIAAGATIGSNHNSRANDGEIVAGRGFWPGLCVDLKHNCRLASFALVAKGSYTYELDIPLPFALVADNPARDRLDVIPAFWFLYNMYAVVRNAWKFQARDKRKHKEQRMEFDYLAPDTVEEIFHALDLLEEWTGKALHRSRGDALDGLNSEALRRQGRQLLAGGSEAIDDVRILGERMENSRREVRIQKAANGYAIYKEMVHYYAIKNLVRFMKENGTANLAELKGAIPPCRDADWVNVGGQIIRSEDLADLKLAIVSGKLASWDDVHDEYDRLWEKYPRDKAAHALGSLLRLNGLAPQELDAKRWFECLARGKETQNKIARLTRESRAKDFSNPFKKLTFDTQGEMDAVMGTIDENMFIRQVEEESKDFAKLVGDIKALEKA